MAEEVFNPPGDEGEAFGSADDALEAAACGELARWLAEHRPGIGAVELDGSGTELWLVNALSFDGETPTLRAIDAAEDPALWAEAAKSWSLLASLSRATHRVVSAAETHRWRRGWP